MTPSHKGVHKLPSQNKKLTDFFPRRESLGSGSCPSSSQPASQTAQTSHGPILTTKPALRTDLEAPPTSGDPLSHISISIDSGQICSDSPRKSREVTTVANNTVRTPRKKGNSRVVADADTRKYFPTPSIRFLGASQAKVAAKSALQSLNISPTKRKVPSLPDESYENIFSDGCSTPSKASPGSISSVLTPLNSERSSQHSISPRKQRDIPSPDKRAHHLSPSASSKRFVPSSQSDEQEMVPPRIGSKDYDQVKQSVSQWQQDVLSDPSPELNDPPPMYGDVSPLPEIHTLCHHSSPEHSEAEITRLLNLSAITTETSGLTDSSWSPCFNVAEASSPPTSEHYNPVLPAALDETSRAAQIIAEIKAHALTETISSPEEIQEFRELEESSDEEKFDPLLMIPIDSKGKGKSRIKFDNNALPSSSKSQSQLRYSLRSKRRHSESDPSSEGSPSTHRSQQRSRKKTAVATPYSKLRPKKGADPIELLLREKRVKDRAGSGTVAIELAKTDTERARRAMLDEVDGETDGESAQETIATKTGQSDGSAAISPTGSFDLEDGLSFVDEPARRILLEDNNQIAKKVVVIGVPLWEEETFMDVDASGDVYQSIASELIYQHPLLDIFRSALQCGDNFQASRIMESNCFSCLDPIAAAAVLPTLCKLGLSTDKTPLAEPAICAALRIWSALPPQLASFPPLIFFHTLARIGARADFLSWPGTRVDRVSKQRRAEILSALLSFVGASARANGVPTKDMPEVILFLLHITLDQTTTSEIKRDASITIDALFSCIGVDQTFFGNAELAICTRLRRYAAGLASVNAASMVSTLASGQIRAQRTARWLAWGILLPHASITIESYRERPPLRPLIELLESGALFNVEATTNEDNTDYEDLGYVVSVFAVAISDIAGYVSEGKVGVVDGDVPLQMSTPSQKTATNEKMQDLLERLMVALKVMDGRIVDTRAARLDRSRAKSSLQRLAMCTSYQLSAALKTAGAGFGKPRKVTEYFPSKDKRDASV